MPHIFGIDYIYKRYFTFTRKAFAKLVVKNTLLLLIGLFKYSQYSQFVINYQKYFHGYVKHQLRQMAKMKVNSECWWK